MRVKLSYIIPTHNRRDALLRTLHMVTMNTPLPREQYEVWVVDNASTDDTPHAVARAFPGVRLIRHRTNDGACARQDAVVPANGELLAFLDDDSWPMEGAIAAAMSHLAKHPRTACVTGPVLLPDGSQEASAYPAAPIACGMVVRRLAMLATGGFTRAFNRQAEEFDLAFKLLKAGWAIDRRDDVRFEHDKPAGGRASADVLRLDLRNNLVVLDRHVPEPLRSELRADWIQRYTAFAVAAGRPEVAQAAVVEADMWSDDERHAPTDALTIEAMFEFRRQRLMVEQWAAAHRVRRVVIAGFAKNLLATWRACEALNLGVLAVADNHPGFKDALYRGVPIISTSLAAALPADGVVVSNINPAQIDAASQQAASQFIGKPVLRLDGQLQAAVPQRQSA